VTENDPKKEHPNVISYSQSGGITAGTVNITNEVAAKPTVATKEVSATELGDDGLYRTRYEVAVEAHYAVSEIYAVVYALSVTAVTLFPRGALMVQTFPALDQDPGSMASMRIRTITPFFDLTVTTKALEKIGVQIMVRL
jgi:hypothetical protein